MPVRTPTPDAVVVPLQYAVALNGRRAPGSGEPSGLVIVCQAALRESSIWLSYSKHEADDGDEQHRDLEPGVAREDRRIYLKCSYPAGSARVPSSSRTSRSRALVTTPIRVIGRSPSCWHTVRRRPR